MKTTHHKTCLSACSKAQFATRTTRVAAPFLALSLATVAITFGLSSVAYADPPPGKGNPNTTLTNPGKANNGNPNKTQNPDQWLQKPLGNTTAELITAGITLAAARALAVDVGAIGFKPLPPGIAKNLARGKPLPPGIATRNLPENLIKGLPRYDGYEWMAAGADLILIKTASRLVADVLTNALR